MSCLFCGFIPIWRSRFQHTAIRTLNFEFLNGFRVQCYSSRRSKKSKASSQKSKSDHVLEIEEENEPFFVLRKGDMIGVYKTLSDCQAQVGSSICDPPVSVYKGFGMHKDTEKYLLSCGLKNALYSIRAADLTPDIFGTLVPCPFQQPLSSNDELSTEDLPEKRSMELLDSEAGNTCMLEFDGASKGNPGLAGAGVVLRANDGTLICKLREGLGVATCNVAEYKAIILGLKFALRKGFTSVHAQGDSKLVCMQIEGLWRVKNQNLSILWEEVKKLKEKFTSFQIVHVLRDLNSDADAQANLAVRLVEGQVLEECKTD